MSPKPITENTLFYGDNLPILREHIPTSGAPSARTLYTAVPLEPHRRVRLQPDAGQPVIERADL